MEKLKCRFSLLFALLLLLASIFTTKDANALELTHGSVHSFTSGYINVFDASAGQSADYNRKIYGSNNDPDLVVSGIPVINPVRQFHLSLSDKIKANSVFTFNVEYRIVGTVPQAPNYQYYGISSGSAWTLLNESCVTPSQNGYGGTANNNFFYQSVLQCTYVGFTNVDLDHISTQYNADIITFRNQNTSASGNMDGSIHFSPVNSRLISWNGLTTDDRSWLEEHLPSGTSTADIESAIDSARESEKEEYESQQDDIEEDVSSSSEDVQEKAGSILDVLGEIVTVLTTAQPTNCNLNGNLIPHLPIGNLNLCLHEPPPIVTIFGTLILVAFVFFYGLHVIRKLLSVIKEFQR